MQALIKLLPVIIFACSSGIFWKHYQDSNFSRWLAGWISVFSLVVTMLSLPGLYEWYIVNEPAKRQTSADKLRSETGEISRQSKDHELRRRMEILEQKFKKQNERKSGSKTNRKNRAKFSNIPSKIVPSKKNKVIGNIAQERSERIRRIQLELKKKGCYRGRIDGDMGPQTLTALANFNKINVTHVALLDTGIRNFSALTSSRSFACFWSNNTVVNTQKKPNCFEFNGRTICE